MAIFDQIALFEAEHNPEIKQAIKETQYNDSSMKLLFWVPLSIRWHSVIVKTPNGRWQATNVDNIPMHGVQIRMFQNLWDEWPSQQAFLKWGASMSGLQVDDWVCFSVIYHAGSTYPINFLDLQYAFLQEKYAGEVENYYHGIRHLMQE